MVSPFLRQSWTVSAVLINMVGQGMLLSYTTSLLPALADPHSPIRADINVASWISSLAGLAGIPGFLVSSCLMDIYGRKITHAIVMVPGVIGWLTIYFAYNIPCIMIGRFLGGFTASATVSLGAIVIGEYSSPKYRGMFLNLKTTAVCLGGMIVHILTNFYHWRTIALLGIIPNMIALLIIFTWKESPSLLAKKQKFDKSKKAFYWLRGKDEASFKELDDLMTAQMQQSKSQQSETTFLEKIMDILKKFTKRDFIKPLTIIFFGTLLLEMSGRHTFPAYALQIIGEITGSKMHSFYYTLAIDLIITGSTLFSSIIVGMAKRRTLLFSTGFAAFVVIMTVCTYLFFVGRGMISNEYNWIAITLFVIYFILVNLGCTPIPLALLGELYPLAHRGVGSAVSGIILSLFLMLGLQLTPHLLASIQVYGTFAVYGIVMGICLVILYFMLPETKDRTLQEIEDYFNYGYFKTKVDHDEEAKEKMMEKNYEG